jgi:hypothetical protein
MAILRRIVSLATARCCDIIFPDGRMRMQRRCPCLKVVPIDRSTNRQPNPRCIHATRTAIAQPGRRKRHGASHRPRRAAAQWSRCRRARATAQPESGEVTQLERRGIGSNLGRSRGGRSQDARAHATPDDGSTSVSAPMRMRDRRPAARGRARSRTTGAQTGYSYLGRVLLGGDMDGLFEQDTDQT